MQVIAIHTFCVLVFRWRFPPLTAHITIAFIWTFIALAIGISFATHKGEMYYGNTGYCMQLSRSTQPVWLLIIPTGCWITSDYPGERMGLEYLWLYIAAAVDILLYTFLALIVQGFVVVDGSKVRFTTGQERVHKEITTYGGGNRSIATGLLFYPAVYVITVGRCHQGSAYAWLTAVRFCPLLLYDGSPFPTPASTSPSRQPHLLI